MQIVSPTFSTKIKLQNLTLTIDNYVDSIIVMLNSNETGYMVFSKSYSDYDENAIKEIEEFINLFNDELETKNVKGTTKLYFELSQYRWK